MYVSGHYEQMDRYSLGTEYSNKIKQKHVLLQKKQEQQAEEKKVSDQMYALDQYERRKERYINCDDVERLKLRIEELEEILLIECDGICLTGCNTCNYILPNIKCIKDKIKKLREKNEQAWIKQNGSMYKTTLLAGNSLD